MRKLIQLAALLLLTSPTWAQTYQGMTIPSGHPRLGGFSDPTTLANARTWWAGQSFTPRTCTVGTSWAGPNCQNIAFAHLMSSSNDCSLAINWAVDIMSKSAAAGNFNVLGDNGSNNYNNFMPSLPLIFDWCYDQMTSAQITTYISGAHVVFGPYLDSNAGGTLPGSGYSDGYTGAGLENNLRAGYRWSAFDWGIAGYWEDTSIAQQNLDEFFNHYWTTASSSISLTTYLSRTYAGGGYGGVTNEGTNYGPAFYEHARIPLVTAKALGRDLMAETNYYQEVPFALIYATTPAPTYTNQFASTYYGMFCWADGHCGQGGYDFLQNNSGTDMALIAANEYGSSNSGKYARTWLNELNAQIPPELNLQAIDAGGSTLAYSGLPLDYYAPGTGFFWLRKAWDTSSTMVKLGLNSLSEAAGHPGQNATGNWEIWRGGRWLSRNTAGYAEYFTGWNNGSTGITVDDTRTANGNGILVNPDNQGTSGGDGGLIWNQQVVSGQDANSGPLIPAQTIRLETQSGYSYAATDTTGAYYVGGYGAGVGNSGNKAVGRVIREFVWVRDLETLVVFDRVLTLGIGSVNVMLSGRAGYVESSL